MPTSARGEPRSACGASSLSEFQIKRPSARSDSARGITTLADCGDNPKLENKAAPADKGDEDDDDENSPPRAKTRGRTNRASESVVFPFTVSLSNLLYLGLCTGCASSKQSLGTQRSFPGVSPWFSRCLHCLGALAVFGSRASITPGVWVAAASISTVLSFPMWSPCWGSPNVLGLRWRHDTRQDLHPPTKDWPASPRLSQELPFRHPAPTPPSPSILSPFLAVGNGARFFYQRTQSILEVMAKLFKRRQVHRGEAQEYSLKREDVNGLFRVLETAACDTNDGVALAVVRECRTALEKLVVRMDSLESGLDRIAERSCTSNLPCRL
ncbi:hypothetical protein DFH09DRAFT_1094550 [Mycena vulgaris]|nr:hypothetical protein DFH09DRAFT_1094550 [Mycena vulgaris]